MLLFCVLLHTVWVTEKSYMRGPLFAATSADEVRTEAEVPLTLTLPILGFKEDGMVSMSSSMAPLHIVADCSE